MCDRLEQIRVAGRHPTEGVARTNFGDRALVAVYTAIMPHLEKERPVAEPIAALDAFGASDAQAFIDGVLVIGIFDERALNRGGRAQTILRAGIQVIRLGFKIAGTKLAISANGESVDTFDGGLFEHTMSGTISTANTFLRVNLPHRCLGRTSNANESQQPA
jgi:hypothetical protein